MLNFNEYQKLSELIKSNPELEPIINNMSLVSLSELSIKELHSLLKDNLPACQEKVS